MPILVCRLHATKGVEISRLSAPDGPMAVLDREEKLEAIRWFPFFEGIPERVLGPLESYFIPKQLERGETLWRAGEKAANFTFIVEGRMKVVKHRSDGRELILGLFEDGEPIGHIAVFEEMDYPATTVALDDTLVLQIHRSHFLGTLREEPKLMEAVLRNVMMRNFQLVRRLHDVTVSGAEQRLARLFDKLAYSTGIRKKRDDGSTYIFIPMPLSRQDLAQLINTRPETAIRLMSKWRDAEIMETTDEGFEVMKPDELEEIAGSADEERTVPVV